MSNQDLINETPRIALADAPDQFPGRPSRATVFRWASRGVRGTVLESFRVGLRRYTTVPAIQRFVAAQNEDVTSPRRQASAESELAELGI